MTRRDQEAARFRRGGLIRHAEISPALLPGVGNSYKLALMLTLCGESFEAVWTDFGGGATRTAEWRRDVNPMGEIPVLEIDGERLTQTAPILLMLGKQFGRFGGETETSSSSCCAGCSGTITSSPATWRPIASCGRSRLSRTSTC
jgi:hypothetical protein